MSSGRAGVSTVRGIVLVSVARALGVLVRSRRMVLSPASRRRGSLITPGTIAIARVPGRVRRTGRITARIALSVT